MSEWDWTFHPTHNRLFRGGFTDCTARPTVSKHWRIVAPEGIWKWGHRSGAKVGAVIRYEAPEYIFLVVPLHLFGSKVQLVVLLSAFAVVSTVWSVSCLQFSSSRGALCVQPIVWWKAYFFHVRKWRKGGWGQVAHGLRTVVGCCEDRRRRRRCWTDLSRDLSNEQTQQERCHWVEFSPKAPKIICVVNVTYSCTSNSHAVCSYT